MKKIYLPVLMAAVLFVVACTKTGLDPLKGTFTAPVELPLQASSLKSSNTSKDDAGRRIFDMDFEQGGTAIHFKLVGDKYFISAGAYIEAEDSKAKKGNFISGLTTVGGKKVKQGTINFQVLNTTETKEGILNEYKINAVLFLEDGKPYKISWNGSLSFEKDKVLEADFLFKASSPAPVKDKDNNIVAGVKNITLTITEKNGVFAAQFSLILPDGVSEIAGAYTVKEYASDPYSAGNGFDMTPFGIDLVIGSYYVKNGAKVVINAGETLTITSESNGLYTIDGNTGYSFLIGPASS